MASAQELRFAIWVNSARETYPVGGEWLTAGPQRNIVSFDSIDEATAHLRSLGYADSTRVEPGRPTAYAAVNPRHASMAVRRG